MQGFLLSPPQQRLQARAAQDGEENFRVQLVLSLTGAVDRERLERCARDTVQAHEVLRSR